MRSRHLILAVLALLCGDVSASDASPTKVVVEEALELETAARTWTPGTVLSRTDSNVSSEVAAVVTWVADPGTRVAQGARIATLENELWRISVADQEANVRALEQRLTFLKGEADRLTSLAEVNNAAQNQLEEAIANRNIANEEIARAKAGLKRDRYMLEHTTIAAPFAGQIVERLVDPGEYVTVGQPVARLVDLINLEVRTQAPLRVAPFVREGDVVPVRTEDRTVHREVSAVIPVGNLESRSFEVRLAWDNHDKEVIGTSVRVGLPTAASRRVLTVPRDALVLRETGPVVFRVSNQTVQRVPVTTGIGADDRIEVTESELEHGDRVVVRGVEFLRDGQNVTTE